MMDHHEGDRSRSARGSVLKLTSNVSLHLLILACAYQAASSHLIGEGSAEMTNLRGGRWLEWEDSQAATSDPLFPLGEADYWGFGLAIVALLAAAGGGMGGGGMLVPIYILVMEMTPKQAIPLSNVTVFGGAIANTLLNLSKRHPEADRPLIDWDLILIMEPLTIVGALIGSFLNILLPETILLVSLVALLSFTAFTTIKKAIKMYKKENLEFSKELKAELVSDDDKKNKAKEIELNIGVNTGDTGGTLRKRSPTAAAASQASETQRSADGNVGVLTGHASQMDDHDTCSSSDEDKSQCVSTGLAFFETYENNKAFRENVIEAERGMPTKNILIIVAMFVVVLAMNILKGGASFASPLGIECGTVSFWLANAALVGWIVGVFFYGRRHLIQRTKLKERIKYPYLESDMVWDDQSTLIFPSICCLAGFFAGMFGIGGGIVKGPLMIAMDVNPRVASASSAGMILFTTFTATSSYAVFGLLLPDYALVCFSIGFVATLIGNTGMSIILKKQKRMSYVAFCIGGVVLISVITMTIESIIHISSSDHIEEVEGLCSVSH
jgi:uncharacterized membrane protein YfcA